MQLVKSPEKTFLIAGDWTVILSIILNETSQVFSRIRVTDEKMRKESVCCGFNGPQRSTGRNDESGE